MSYTLFDSLSAAQRRSTDGGPLVARFPDDPELWNTPLVQVAHNEPERVHAWTHRHVFTLVDPWAGPTGRAWSWAPRAVLPGSEGAASDRPRDPAPAGSIWRGETTRDAQWWHVLVAANPETGAGTFVWITLDHDDGTVRTGVSVGGPAAYPPGIPGGALPGTDSDVYVGVPTLAQTPANVVTVDSAAGAMLADVLRARVAREHALDPRHVATIVDQTMTGAPRHHSAVALTLGASIECGDDEWSLRRKIVERL